MNRLLCLGLLLCACTAVADDRFIFSNSSNGANTSYWLADISGDSAYVYPLGWFNSSGATTLIASNRATLILYFVGCNIGNGATACGLFRTDISVTNPERNPSLVQAAAAGDFMGCSGGTVTIVQGRLLWAGCADNAMWYESEQCALDSATENFSWLTNFYLPGKSSIQPLSPMATLAFNGATPYIGDIGSNTSAGWKQVPATSSLAKYMSDKVVLIPTVDGAFYLPYSTADAAAYPPIRVITTGGKLSCTTPQFTDYASVTTVGYSNMPTNVTIQDWTFTDDTLYLLDNTGAIYTIDAKATVPAYSMPMATNSTPGSLPAFNSDESVLSGVTLWFIDANNNIIVLNQGTLSSSWTKTWYTGAPTGQGYWFIPYGSYIYWYNSAGTYKQSLKSNFTSANSLFSGLGSLEQQVMDAQSTYLEIYHYGSVSTTCDGTDYCALLTAPARPSPAPPAAALKAALVLLAAVLALLALA